MVDSLQPPTDNLYKFLAISALAFAMVILIYLLREQSRLREQYVNAQVELRTAGYEEGSGEPHDTEMRRNYFRLQLTVAEAKELHLLAGGYAAKGAGGALGVSLVAFWLWNVRVQKHEDAILRLTAEKMAREMNAEDRLKVRNDS